MEQSMIRVITRLARKSQMCIGQALKRYNISAAEEPFFMALRYRERVTQEDLTALVCVDKAATARAVQSLEKKQLLIREQDQHDRRQNRVSATKQAKEIGADVLHDLLQLNERITKDIPPEQLEITYQVLMKMDKNVSDIFGQHKEESEGR